VSELPGFNEGVVSVQDAAAQLAAPALLHYFFKQAEKREIRILDACAAPGGKTLHLLQLARENGLPVIVTALDKDEERLQRVRENLMRANVHMQAECLVANATNTQSWWDGRAYDAILLDAPCSASGIVRRHPDIPWLRRESDIAKLAQEQSDLLQRLWPLLKPGGYLLYATCSIWPQEGIMQIEKLIQSLASAEDSATLCGEHQMLPKSYRLWTENNSTYETPLANKSILIQEHESDEAFQRNDLIDHDGFYFALLQKRYESG
jgi:16S rRNA (cytosine967-C5)-methyltransferase